MHIVLYHLYFKHVYIYIYTNKIDNALTSNTFEAIENPCNVNSIISSCKKKKKKKKKNFSLICNICPYVYIYNYICGIYK